MELQDLLQPGKAARIDYGKGNVNNCTRHIIAIVDETIIVYRVWSKYRRTWEYYTSHKFEWEFLLEKGILKEAE